MNQYDLQAGLFKSVKYALIGTLSLLVYTLPLAYPEVMQISLIGALSFLANYAKVRWGVKLP